MLHSLLGLPFFVGVSWLRAMAFSGEVVNMEIPVELVQDVSDVLQKKGWRVSARAAAAGAWNSGPAAAGAAMGSAAAAESEPQPPQASDSAAGDPGGSGPAQWLGQAAPPTPSPPAQAGSWEQGASSSSQPAPTPSWIERARSMAVSQKELVAKGAPLHGQSVGSWHGAGRDRIVPSTAGSWTVPRDYADDDTGVASGHGSWKGGAAGMAKR